MINIQIPQKFPLTYLTLLTLVAFLIRLGAVIWLFDIPGDGPSRAMIAYDWAESPYIVTHGVWLPGFTYLAGIFSLIVHNPLFSTRILNLILGTATIPVMYVLLNQVFGKSVAIFSATVTAFFPLHVGLSASSLTEVSFMLLVFLSSLFMIYGFQENQYRIGTLSIAFFCFLVAESIRYEAWILIPCFILYIFLKTRRLAVALSALLLMILLPISWMICNHLYLGNALIGFTEAARGTDTGAESVSLLQALLILAGKLSAYLGWFLPILALIGLGDCTFRNFKLSRRWNPEEIFFITVNIIFWLIILRFTISRGSSLWDRNILFGFSALLPFVLYPFRQYLSADRKRIWLVSLLGSFLVLASFGTSKVISNSTSLFVTHDRPDEIISVVRWLKTSPYQNTPMVITKMSWDSMYLPLYYPEASDRLIIVSLWLSGDTLEDFLKDHPSFLLITTHGDRNLQDMVTKMSNTDVNEENLVHEIDGIKIYNMTQSH